MRGIVVFLAGVLAAAASYADVLWGKAESGASVAAIASLYPEGASVTPSEKQRLDNGAALRFRIARIEIAGKDFDVSFYFLEDKLTQVTLSHKSSEPVYGCEQTLSNLQEGLRAKYGNELKNSRLGGLGVSRSASWASGKTTVSLNMFAYDTPACSIYLAYSSRISELADKL